MQPAYVLHRWPYQEHSLIVELFSAEQGRVRVVARGARRSKKGQAALLQPFRLLQVEWRGRSDLKTLTSVDTGEYVANLAGDYLYCGFYINELLQRLMPEHAAIPALFNDYQHTIDLLRQELPMEPVLRKFEWRLLCHLELEFDWQHEVEQGEPVVADGVYYFRPGEGFARVWHGREPTPHFGGADIARMADFALQDPQLLNQFKFVMRRALGAYLGNKPLRSRELFQGKPAPSGNTGRTESTAGTTSAHDQTSNTNSKE